MTSQIPTSGGMGDADDQTLQAVHAVMQKDPRKMTLAGRHAKASDRLPPLDAPARGEADAQPRSARGVRSGIASVRGYRPTRRHLTWMGIAVLVLLRPWWVFGPILLTLLALTAFFAICGREGAWDRIMAGLDRYAMRRPERAARLTRRLDLWAEKWDGVLDRLPESWAETLALPCFADRAAQAAAYEARVADRLSRMDSTA